MDVVEAGALVSCCRPAPPCLAMMAVILPAMSLTVRASIKSSSSIMIPNWLSAASMMIGRRLERMARSFRRSISGWISSRSYPVASMMMRMSRSRRSWPSGTPAAAGDAGTGMAGVERAELAGKNLLLAFGRPGTGKHGFDNV